MGLVHRLVYWGSEQQPLAALFLEKVCGPAIGLAHKTSVRKVDLSYRDCIQSDENLEHVLAVPSLKGGFNLYGVTRIDAGGGMGLYSDEMSLKKFGHYDQQATDKIMAGFQSRSLEKTTLDVAHSIIKQRLAL